MLRYAAAPASAVAKRVAASNSRLLSSKRRGTAAAAFSFSSLSSASAAAATTTTTELLEAAEQLHLYMWGTDSSGSLLKPDNRADEKVLDVPVEAPEIPQLHHEEAIKFVVCGPTDTAVITTAGRCLVAGENKQGHLGAGHKNPVQQLTEIKLPAEHPETTGVKQVALGSAFAAYVDTVGDLYTAGFGGSTFSGMGALGHGNADSYTEPTLVASLVEDGCAVKQVCAGEAHMTVLTEEGEVLTTGAGSYGRLGNFDTVDQLYLEPTEILTTDMHVTEIAGGKSFTLALTDSGVVYGWGRNHKGQLGTGLGLAVDMYAMTSVPEPIEADELVNRRVTKIAAGHSHAACITDNGELFYWGMTLHLEPVRVDALLHTKIVDVVCGQDYTLAVDHDGRMYSFGKGKTGVLGQGSVKRLNQPAVMEALENVEVVQVSAGWKHAAALVRPRE
jgi:alpha-tubulin suppressor-like RCC1 family protein